MTFLAGPRTDGLRAPRVFDGPIDMRDARKRSVDDARRHLRRLIDTIEPQACRNCTTNAAYAPT